MGRFSVFSTLTCPSASIASAGKVEVDTTAPHVAYSGIEIRRFYEIEKKLTFFARLSFWNHHSQGRCRGVWKYSVFIVISDKKNILLAAASGLLLTSCFPKVGWDPVAWAALIPLLYGLKDQQAGGAFRLGFAAGLVHFFSLLYWLVPVMNTYGYLPLYLGISVLFLFAAVLAVFIALFAAAVSLLATTPARALITIPVLWVALEYLRSFIFSGFPWELLGYSQFQRLRIIQISDIIGVYGVSALIVLCNTAILFSGLYLARKKWRMIAVRPALAAGALITAAVAMTLTWFYGQQRLVSIDQLIADAPKARIAVIQGNIDQTVKWNSAFQLQTVARYNRLSRAAVKDKAELIVWPESATPFYLMANQKMSQLVITNIERTRTDYLIGSPSFVRRGATVQYFNSAYLIRPGQRTIIKYDKTHLVPYGEYVPLRKWLPFLGKIVAQVGDFMPGKEGRTLPWGRWRLGVQICYEIIFPALSRALVQNGAAVLINITNDAWFGRTSGPYQHFSMTVFRAVENRRALARAANTGISGFIDPAGRVLAKTPLLQQAVVTRTVPLLETKSLYTRFGDLLAQACLAAALLAAAAATAGSVLKFRSGRR